MNILSVDLGKMSHLISSIVIFDGQYTSKLYILLSVDIIIHCKPPQKKHETKRMSRYQGIKVLLEIDVYFWLQVPNRYTAYLTHILLLL
jgi:hypothetical protein